ncbi:MAG TPA: hypothetical protein VIN73_12330 [Vicingaceae bacterium]
MKKTFIIVLSSLIGLLAFGQKNDFVQIDYEVNSIELDSSLVQIEFDWVELTGITTDGGGILTVWQNDKQICKIVEEIGLSYGRIKTTIYLKDEIPIKIIETEENFGLENGELNYGELKEVFRVIIYVLDWENDDSKTEWTGKRIMSEGTCSTFEYEPIIEQAKKAIANKK